MHLISEYLQTMTSLPVHLTPSRAGKALCVLILVIVLILYSILLHLAIMAANKDCCVVWDVKEKVDMMSLT